MEIYAYVILGAGTFLWALPFPLVHRKQDGLASVDRRARAGIALQAAAYTLLWQGSFWTRSPGSAEVLASVLLFAAACALSWTGAFALGRHLQVDAAVGREHKLVRSGPYRFVRHPIYTSMLGLLAGTGLLIAPWYLFAPALAVFLTGTHIRIRAEDMLLESRFGEEFRAYSDRVAGLIPFVI